MREIWQKCKEKLFYPPEARWLLWLGLAPLAVLASATFALFVFSPYHAIVLFLTLFASLVFWKVSTRVGILIVGAVTAFAIFTFPENMRWWNACWLISLASGMVVSLFVISEATAFFMAREKKAGEFLKDAELWQNRFGTMKEKIEEDRKLWETEMDLLQKEIGEKNSHVLSLKTLLEVIHRDAAHAAKRVQEVSTKQEAPNFEIDGKVVTKEEVERIMNDLNFYRTEHYQVNLLLEEAKEKLKSQEDAIQERQRRNHSLLGTNTKKSISLKDLAKKV